jgi:hypothetical protein
LCLIEVESNVVLDFGREAARILLAGSNPEDGLEVRQRYGYFTIAMDVSILTFADKTPSIEG